MRDLTEETNSMRPHRGQIIKQVLLGGLLGSVILLAHHLVSAYLWLSYIQPITAGMPSSTLINILLGVILLHWRTFLQIRIGFLLGCLTTYTWLQRETHPPLAMRASLGGGLLLAVPIFCYRLYLAVYEAVTLFPLYNPRTGAGITLITHDSTVRIQGLLFHIVLNLFDLSLLWSLGLVWLGLQLRLQVKARRPTEEPRA